MKRSLIAASSGFVLIALAAACSGGGGGGNGGGTATITGPIAGGTFVVKSAISTKMAVAGGDIGAILLTDIPNACSIVGGGTQPPNLRYVILQLGDFSGSAFSAPAAPGDYPIWDTNGVPPAKVAVFQYTQTDALCATTVNVVGTGGSLSLTSASTNVWNGTGTVAAGTSGTVTVAFNPAYCPALAAVLENPTPPACQ